MGFYAGNGFNPAREECGGNVDRGKEEDDEDGYLHHRASMDGAKSHRDSCSPQASDEIDEQCDDEEAQKVYSGTADVHSHKQSYDRDDGGREHPSAQGCERVPGQDARAVASLLGGVAERIRSRNPERSRDL